MKFEKQMKMDQQKYQKEREQRNLKIYKINRKYEQYLIERNNEHEMRMLQMEIERQKQKELGNHNRRLMK